MEYIDNQKLCAYYFASEAFDQAHNIIDSFLPLVESVLVSSAKLKYSYKEIEQKINSDYKVQIPKDTLRQMLDTLHRADKIFFESRKTIHVKPEAFVESKHTEAVQLRLYDMFISFYQYLQRHGVSVDYDNAKKALCTYIYSHSADLASLLNGKKVKSEYLAENQSDFLPYLDELLTFILEEKSKGTENYQSLLRLYEGAVQTSLLNFKPNQIKNIQNNEMGIENVILDSNFLMRILDIQTEVECETALQTFESLKGMSVKMYALDITLKEINKVIQNFIANTEGYTVQTSEYYRKQSFKMSGLLAAVYRGKSRTSILELSKNANLRIKLERMGITIIEMAEDADVSRDDIESLLTAKDRFSYREPQAKHDLHLIRHCRSCRPKRIDSIKRAGWWVITNDIRLTHWNQENKRDDYQECISETQLSNLMWICGNKVGNDGLVNTIVALANNNLLGLQDVIRFQAKVDEYNERHKADQSALDTLAIVYANGMLNNNDVKRVVDQQMALEDLVLEKTQQIKIKEQKQLEYTESIVDENAELKQKAQALVHTTVIQNIEKEQLELQLKASQLREYAIDTRFKLKTISDDISKRDSIVSRKKTKCRVIGWIICYPLFFILFLFVMMGVAKFVPPNMQGHSMTVLIAFVLNTTLSGAGVVITGKQKKPSEFIDDIADKMAVKQFKKYLTDNGRDYTPDTIDGELIKIISHQKNNEEDREILQKNISQLEFDLSQLRKPVTALSDSVSV